MQAGTQTDIGFKRKIIRQHDITQSAVKHSLTKY